MRRWLVRMVSAVLVAAVVSPSAHALSLDPLAGAPLIGDCHNLTAADIAAESEDTTPVTCQGDHTAKVLGVYLVPDSWDWTTVSANSQYKFALNQCLPDFRAALGGSEASRHRTAYQIAWFVPTETERIDGARWLSCFLWLPKGTGVQFLPRDEFPLAEPPFGDRVTLCLNAQTLWVTCNMSHTYRVTGTYAIKGSWPGTASVETLAFNKCESRTTTEVYYAIWMNKQMFQAGDRTIRCLSKLST